MENAKLFLSRISPKFTIGSDPMTDFSMTLELNQKSNDIDEILQLPEKIAQKKGVSIVICIDEFQQMAELERFQNIPKTPQGNMAVTAVCFVLPIWKQKAPDE